MTKIADIRGKSPDELKSMLLDLRKEQFNLRFQRASGQLENTSRMREVRRDIARVMTIARQKQLGAVKQSA
jgi:large subunit ribosomal protein L29